MSTDKESSAAGTDNRPPMLVESDYDSWKIRIHRYIRGKPLGKLIWNSIQNGPSPHPMVTDAPTEGQTGVNMPRMKLDSEFTPEETNCENDDTQAEIILSQELSKGMYQFSERTERAKDSQYFKDKMLLMEAKEKGVTLDAEAEAFLANVEYLRRPNLQLLSWPICHPPGNTSTVNEVHPNAIQINDSVNYQLSHEMHHEEQSDSDVESELDDNTTPYHQLELERRANVVPTEELSREQVYWLPANEIASQASAPATPVTPYVPKSPPPSQVLATLHNIKAVFPQFDAIIKERTTVKPLYVSLPCYEYAKEFALQQVVPFLDYFKTHVQTADDTIVKEVAEFKEIHYALEDEYERCVLENKNLIIEKKNLLIKNDSLITECLERDICSIVLYSDVAVTPSSNCLCEELRSNCDREHSKVVELEAEILKKQQMLNESEKRCAFIEKKSHEPPRTSNRPTQKPPVQQNKKPNLSTRTKPATESRKPMPKSHTQNHRILPSKSVNTRRAADYNRKLNVVDHNQFVIRSLKSVKPKTNPRPNIVVNHTKGLKATKIIMFVGRTVADSITERLKRATTYVLRQIDFSLLSRNEMLYHQVDEVAMRHFISFEISFKTSSEHSDLNFRCVLNAIDFYGT
ncbi:hypothetical protein Tco_1575338 [Tanacetum coccineum]